MHQAPGNPLPIGYRPDIDGLRAIAIILVVLYHFFPKTLSGGFIGVDVFFVISGYLITRIISTELAKGRFTFANFYAHRVKRIFPALLVVLLATYGLGWALLHDTEFRRLSKHLFASTLFLNNFLLRNEKGYFDSASESKPLLHFWSLSIEEQFYLAWPLFLWLMLRWLKKPQPLLLLVCFASFAINVFWAQSDLVAAFYLPFSRAWELILGGLIALTPKHVFQSKLPTHASTIGLVSLALMAVTFHEGMRYPGFWALAVVTATLFIICGTVDSNHKILSHPLAIWVGRISYPLYLWHWPLISFGFIVFPLGIPNALKIILLILAFALAWLTKEYIEDPIRFRSRQRPAVFCLIVSLIIVGCVAVMTYQAKGIPSRGIHARNVGLGSGHETLSKASYETCQNLKIPNECKQEAGKKVRFVLMGDSKAASLLSGLIQTNTSDDGWMFIGGNAKEGAPIPLISDAPELQKYSSNYRSALKQVGQIEGVKWLVMAVSTRGLFQLRREDSLIELMDYPDYQGVLERFSRGIEQATKLGIPLLFIIDNPTFPAPEKCASRDTGIDFMDAYIASYRPACQITLDAYFQQAHMYRKLIQDMQKRFPDRIIATYDTLPDLCDINHSVCSMHKDGRYLYGTTDHISEFAARLIGAKVNDFLQQQK